MKIKRVLIANRGEIAVRIVHACQLLGIETVLAVSEADKDSLGAKLADRTVCIGPAWPSESYLDSNRLLAAALLTECDALHPGYGFLAESAELAQSCKSNGIIFVGPEAEQIAQMGNKIRARRLAEKYGVPTLPGTERVNSVQEAAQAVEKVGLPVILKAAAGGGGRGMRLVQRSQEFEGIFTSTAAEAEAAFGDGSLYIEKFISNARHIEVQIIADEHGNVVHLGERDCSLQRRHQKLVEEAPAPGLAPELRQKIHKAAVAFAQGFSYKNAGTVEFILDCDTSEFYFLEMNTRIQVEHPVTEMITGIDLVTEQLKVAAGEPLSFSQEDVFIRGHAIECRITAELATENFCPSPGLIKKWQAPNAPNIRVDTHCFTGYEVPVFYDSLLAKVIAYGADRAEAIQRMQNALNHFVIEVIDSTVQFQYQLLDDPRFRSAKMNTHMVDEWLGGQ